MRLFVALELPQPIRSALAELAPVAARGLRAMRADQMHVTLHFIGAAETAPVRAALASVAAAPFEVAVRGVGSFEQRGGRAILFAGVVVSDELMGLHAAVGRALATIGFVPERRRFRPHVTVARLEAAADRAVAAAWLEAARERDFGTFVARRFALFDSVTDDEGARYVELDAYALR